MNDFKVDPLLQELCNKSEELGIGIPITLLVKGCIVSGWLIGISIYSELISKEILMPNNDKPIVTVDPSERGFVYLRDAYFMSAPPYRSDRKLLWRGRMDAVDGFTYGSMKAEGSKSIVTAHAVWKT